MADDDEGEKIRCVLDFVAVVGFTDQATSPSEEARELDPSDAHVRLGEVDGSGAPHVRFFERAARGPSDEPITDIVIVKPTLGERFPPDYELLSSSHRGFAANVNLAQDDGVRTPTYIAYKRGSIGRPVAEVRLVEYGENGEFVCPEGLIPLRRTVAGNDGAFNLGSTGRSFLLCFRRSRRDIDSVSQSSSGSIQSFALQHLVLLAPGVQKEYESRAARDPEGPTITEMLANDCFGSVASAPIESSRSAPDLKSLDMEPSGETVIVTLQDTMSSADALLLEENHEEDPINIVSLSPEGTSVRLYGAYSLSSEAMGGAYVYPAPPVVLDRYPLADTKEQTLPVALSMFCQPLGAQYRRSPSGCRFLTFVLTNAMGEPVFVTALQFYERQEATVTSSISGRQVPFYTLKSFCTISMMPFYHHFQEALVHLHTLTSASLSVPWERHMSNLFEVPVPPPRVVVTMSVGDHDIKFWRPDRDDMPLLRFPSDLIFRYLSVRNVVQLLSLLMLEVKVVVHSHNECLLTPVLESLISVILPLRWTNIYIPVFTEQLADFLQAIVPFVFGMTTETYQRLQNSDSVPDDIAVVDLDANQIDSPVPLPWLPLHQALMDRLMTVLTDLNNEYRTLFIPDGRASSPRSHNFQRDTLKGVLAPVTPDKPVKHLPQVSEHMNDIREAFLHFMCRLLARYNDFLQAPPTGKDALITVNDLFDREGFCATKSSTSRDFYYMLFDTITFNKLIEDRTFEPDQDGLFMYFDTQMEKQVQVAAPAAAMPSSGTKTPVSKVKGGTSDASSSPAKDAGKRSRSASKSKVRKQRLAERTYTVPRPNAAGIPESSTYTYVRFPRFDASAFVPARPTKSSELIAWPSAPPPTTPSAIPRRLTSGGASRVNNSSPRRVRYSLRRSSTAASTAVAAMAAVAAQNAGANASVPASSRQQALSACEEIKTAAYCVWFRLFSAYGARAADAKQAIKYGLSVLWQLRSVEGLVPDYLVYQCLLEVCGRRGLADEARYIMRDMAMQGIQGDAVAYGWQVQAVAGTMVAPASAAANSSAGSAGASSAGQKFSTLFESPLGMSGLVMRVECVCSAGGGDSGNVGASSSGIVGGCGLTLSEAAIVSGWNGDDEGSNTECPGCARHLHPRIIVEYAREQQGAAAAFAQSAADARGDDGGDASLKPQASASASSTLSSASASTSAAWFGEQVPASVAFLKPTVLFAELSAVLSFNKGIARSKAAFLRDHPLLFWNCVYYFSALDVPFDSIAAARLLKSNEATREFAVVPISPSATASRTFFGSFWSRNGGSATSAALNANSRTSVASGGAGGRHLGPPAPALGTLSSTAAGAAAPPAPPLPAAPAAPVGPTLPAFVALANANPLSPSATTLTVSGSGFAIPSLPSHPPMRLSLKVTGIRRRLLGWPRRDYSNAQSFMSLRWDNARDATVLRFLEQINEKMSSGQLQAAVTFFIQARLLLRDEPIFKASCYEHLVRAALRPSPLPPKPRPVAIQPSLMLPQQAMSVPYADGDSIDFVMENNDTAAALQQSAGSPALLGESTAESASDAADDTGSVRSGTTLRRRVIAQTGAYESEMDIADAYKAVMQSLEPDVKSSLTQADEAPSVMVITLRATFPDMRL